MLREIKAKSPATRVFVLTAHLDERYRRPCRDAGADFYLSKATDLPLLAGILADLAKSGRSGSEAPARSTSV